MRLHLIAVICLLLSGCANPYAKYYHDQTGGEDLTRSPQAILSPDKPAQIRGSDRSADDVRMLEDGFRLIGISSFNGPTAEIKQMLVQAEQVGASAVVTYPPRYIGTGVGVGGTRYTYHFFVSYWVKLKPPVLGAYFDDLSVELRQKTGSDKGVVVIAVVKNSPASSVDIRRGDVLRQIGEKEIIDKKTSEGITSQYAGKKVTVKLLRDGKEFLKDVTFNERM